jgi:putative heme-binding domain-containing protein
MKTLAVQFAILLIAATAVATLWLGMSVTQTPLTKVDLDRGASVFQDRCASCHSTDHQQASLYGPSLSRIGALAAGRNSSLSAEEYLLQSIIDPNAFRFPGEHGVMPADISTGLDPTDLISLVGFLMKHDGVLDWPRLVSLIEHAKAPEALAEDSVTLADVEAGKKIYLTQGKCIQCHPLQATPGGSLRAPSLLAAGQHSQKYLRESIQHPSKVITKGYGAWNVWLEDGRTVSGRLLRSTPETIELLADVNGNVEVVAVDRTEIFEDEEDGEMLVQTPQSKMPNNLMAELSAEDFEKLLAFLRTLR